MTIKSQLSLSLSLADHDGSLADVHLIVRRRFDFQIHPRFSVGAQLYLHCRETEVRGSSGFSLSDDGFRIYARGGIGST